MAKLVGVDPVTGTAHYVDYDEETDTYRVIEEVDASALLDLNQQFYNDAPTRFGGDGLVGVARVKMPLWFDLKRKGILDDEKALRRWLNDGDNRRWRTRPGSV